MLLQKLVQAKLEAVAHRSPVTAKFIDTVIQYGTYDDDYDCYYLPGVVLRTRVWEGREEKKAKNCLNAMCNARVGKGKKRHVGSVVIDKHFPNRRWDRKSDVVFIS